MSSYYEPFNNAEEVWFWYFDCLAARGEGLRARQNFSPSRKSIEIVDIQKIIKFMKQNNQINNRVLRVMVRWGEQGIPPTYNSRAKPSETELWNLGIGWLEYHLKHKGVL